MLKTTWLLKPFAGSNLSNASQKFQRTTIAARNAPMTWAPQYGSTLPHANPRRTASASVTAGLMCAPEIPPAT